jgi:hypothetical protein
MVFSENNQGIINNFWYHVIVIFARLTLESETICFGNISTRQTGLYGVWWHYRLDKHNIGEILCGAVGAGHCAVGSGHCAVGPGYSASLDIFEQPEVQYVHNISFQ